MFVSVFVTAANKIEAGKIAGELVKERLVACVNIIENVTSVYRWEGKIEKSPEVLMIMKTKKSIFVKLAKRIKALHSYSLPEIIALPIEKGSKEYLKWIEKSVL